jgi:hypothetical protein
MITRRPRWKPDPKVRALRRENMRAQDQRLRELAAAPHRHTPAPVAFGGPDACSLCGEPETDPRHLEP